MNKAVDTHVVAQRQVSQVHVVAEIAEIPQLQVADKVVDVPSVFIVLVTQVQVVEKTVETPHLLSDVQDPHVQAVGKTVQIPQFPFGEKIAAEIRMTSGTQTSESLNGEFDAGHDEKSVQERQPHNSSKQTNAKSTRERE